MVKGVFFSMIEIHNFDDFKMIEIFNIEYFMLLIDIIPFVFQSLLSMISIALFCNACNFLIRVE